MELQRNRDRASATGPVPVVPAFLHYRRTQHRQTSFAIENCHGLGLLELLLELLLLLLLELLLVGIAAAHAVSPILDPCRVNCGH
jgi:hypothetical protein